MKPNGNNHAAPLPEGPVVLPSPPSASDSLRLVPLPIDALHALLRGDLEAASILAGVNLTPYFVEHRWLWDIRIAQIHHDPPARDWIARAAVDGDMVVGHVGFHGPPDERGMVEVAYSVDPMFRRLGYGKRMLGAALNWAHHDPSVTFVRATVVPTNVASIRILAGFPFELVGEQWDDEDGLELVYEMPVVVEELPKPQVSK